MFEIIFIVGGASLIKTVELLHVVDSAKLRKGAKHRHKLVCAATEGQTSRDPLSRASAREEAAHTEKAPAESSAR